MKKVKCTKKAKVALKKSITVWEVDHAGLVADDIVPTHYYITCPLCQECRHLGACLTGVNCPISIDTGEDCCEGTPYEEWDEDRTSIPKHLAMVTYMKDLYKRCEVVK